MKCPCCHGKPKEWGGPAFFEAAARQLCKDGCFHCKYCRNTGRVGFGLWFEWRYQILLIYWKYPHYAFACLRRYMKW